MTIPKTRIASETPPPPKRRSIKDGQNHDANKKYQELIKPILNWDARIKYHSKRVELHKRIQDLDQKIATLETKIKAENESSPDKVRSLLEKKESLYNEKLALINKKLEDFTLLTRSIESFQDEQIPYPGVEENGNAYSPESRQSDKDKTKQIVNDRPNYKRNLEQLNADIKVAEKQGNDELLEALYERKSELLNTRLAQYSPQMHSNESYRDVPSAHAEITSEKHQERTLSPVAAQLPVGKPEYSPLQRRESPDEEVQAHTSLLSYANEPPTGIRSIPLFARDLSQTQLKQPRPMNPSPPPRIVTPTYTPQPPSSHLPALETHIRESSQSQTPPSLSLDAEDSADPIHIPNASATGVPPISLYAGNPSQISSPSLHLPDDDSLRDNHSESQSPELLGHPQRNSQRDQPVPLPPARKTSRKTQMFTPGLPRQLPNSTQSLPATPRSTLATQRFATPSIEEALTVDEAERPVSPVVAPATVTMQSSSPLATHPFKAKLKWGEFEYIVEQDLPPETTEEDWQAIVKAYEQILNVTANSPQCHPGINRLQLSLDANHGAMNIEIPSVNSNTSAPGERLQPITIAVRGQIVNDLLHYHTHTERNALQFYRSEETLPEIEETHTPLGLANTTGTLCYANALLQMIMAYPYLRDTIKEHGDNDLLKELISSYADRDPTDTEISTLSNDVLEDVIKGSVQTVHRQEDILHAFESLITKASSTDNVHDTLSAALPIVDQLFRKTDDQTVPPEGASQDASDPNLYTRTILTSGSHLPILTLNPDPHHPMTLSQAISKSSEWKAHTPPPDAAPSDQAPLISERKRFAAAPKTLVIHANRNHSDGSTKKNQGKIALSEKVAIPRTLVSEENRPPLYQLRSFAVHIGNQTNYGHYIAYVKVKGSNGKTLYYEMNDSIKKQISQRDFLRASENFALAFYDNISEVVEDRHGQVDRDDPISREPRGESARFSPSAGRRNSPPIVESHLSDIESDIESDTSS